jgi:hypothetical protein
LIDIGERIPRQQNPGPLTVTQREARSFLEDAKEQVVGVDRLHDGDLFLLEEFAQWDREGAQPRIKRHVPQSGLDEGVQRHQVPQ